MEVHSLHLVADIRKSPGLRMPGAKRKSFMGQIMLVLVGVQLAFFGSFTSLNLPTATGSNLICALNGQVRKLVLLAPIETQSKIRQVVPRVFDELCRSQPKEPRLSIYTPLAPIAVFIGYVLGPRLAAFSTLSFLLAGILGPFVGIYPFASGGGVRYYLEPGFGYLIGMVAGSSLCGFLTHNKRTSLSQLLGIVLGLLALHATGILCLIGSYLYFYLCEGSKSYVPWQPWMFQYVRNLSWYAIPYDVLFSFLAVGLAFPFRWLVSTLTASDIAPPKKRIKYNRKALEELVGN